MEAWLQAGSGERMSGSYVCRNAACASCPCPHVLRARCVQRLVPQPRSTRIRVCGVGGKVEGGEEGGGEKSKPEP